MNMIAVDDEQYAQEALKSAIQEVFPESSLSCFDDSEAALEYARSLKNKNSHIDAAFLDIEMSGINGLELAKRLKDIYGKTCIVFVTGHSKYAIDAFSLRANGYILKPFTAKTVRETLEHLQAENWKKEGSLSRGGTLEKILRVQTFGNFEVFVKGKILKFNRIKTKELFAYLISRKGALCNNNEIAAVLWEDKEDSVSLQTQFRKLVADLTKKLDEAGFGDVLVRERGHLAVEPDKISCDFYDFCAGINVNSYMGEFMNQYSWAEFTNTYLDRIHKRKSND